MRSPHAPSSARIWGPVAPRSTHATQYALPSSIQCSVTFRTTISDNSLLQTALTYGCLCDDGKTPNVSQYSLTLPYFVCQEWGTQCVADCGSDNTCAGACRQDHPCGALDPSPANKTNSTTTASGTASSTASSTSTDAAVFTSLGGGDSASAGPPTFELTRLYTTFGTLGMFFAGFVFLL